jgi:hypothetical protein
VKLSIDGLNILDRWALDQSVMCIQIQSNRANELAKGLSMAVSGVATHSTSSAAVSSAHVWAGSDPLASGVWTSRDDDLH